MVILAWVLYFVAMCFMPILPWTTCDNSWNTISCIPLFTETDDNATNVTSTATSSNVSGYLATEEFWRYNVLDISTGLEDPGHIRWHLLLATIAAFALVYVCIFKGIESSRIAVYITATAPFILLVLLLAWLMTREGSTDGLMYYITPRWDKVMRFQTWLEAFLQVFYSLGPGWGGLINLSSYNPFHHNWYRDSIIVALADTITSVLCGAVVFAGVGCIAHQTGENVSDVFTTGPGLSFITYPQVIATMPVPHLWAACFFLLLLFLGLDTQFAMIKTVTTGLTDMYPKSLGKKQPLLVFVVLLFSIFLTLPFITRGGIYIFQIIDWYASFFTILAVVSCESIVIGWVFGADRFVANIKEMGTFASHWQLRFMKISWRFLVPFCMLGALIVAMVKFRSPKYGEYEYPEWTNVFGWILALSSSVPVPVVMIYGLMKEKGSLLENTTSDTSNHWENGHRDTVRGGDGTHSCPWGTGNKINASFCELKREMAGSLYKMTECLCILLTVYSLTVLLTCQII
ncbi:sodium- and chloride-dependent GABA transporter 1-like isoform X2 [Liolophura sinensis]|uniref:sodium- and chloride-dependent GABA transporter 1-like isoform X2 n=1 Tax=Liolophura sinensis TaxID=3198878 RepID=UPI00315873CF